MSQRDATSVAMLFEGIPFETVVALYIGACETIVELERALAGRITNEPGTSWEIADGRLHIRLTEAAL